MRHYQESRAVTFVNLPEALVDVGGIGRIKVACWLVSENQGRLVDEGPYDDGALLLSARRIGDTIVLCLGDSYQVEQFISQARTSGVVLRVPMAFGMSTFSRAVNSGSR